jgi:hypothetical protein
MAGELDVQSYAPGASRSRSDTASEADAGSDEDFAQSKRPRVAVGDTDHVMDSDAKEDHSTGEYDDEVMEDAGGAAAPVLAGEPSA